MDAEALEKLLKLVILGQQALAEVMVIVTNHKIQEGKTNEQILAEAGVKTQEALDIINSL